MKYSRTLVICCLLSLGVAAKEKQIKLEDIERDNLQSERQVKDDRQERKLSQDIVPPQPQQPPPQYRIPQQQLQQAIAKIASPKVQYGFVPVRTPESYVHAPAASAQEYQSYQVAQPQQSSPQYTQAYLPPQQYYTTTQTGGEQQQQQQQYVQYENVPYVVDNHLSQNPQQQQQQQYYQTQPQQQQQYVYLQPYSSASNNIHSVVDAKGHIQYVMYVPASYLASAASKQQQQQQQPDYENLVVPTTYEDPSAGQVNYPTPDSAQPPTDYQNQVVEYQYLPESPAQKYLTQSQYLPTASLTKPAKYTKVDYIGAGGNGPDAEIPQRQQYQPQLPPPPHYAKKEPQSLLDSYVPSVLQYQLYKQQQANALRQSIKLNTRTYLPQH